MKNYFSIKPGTILIICVGILVNLTLGYIITKIPEIKPIYASVSQKNNNTICNNITVDASESPSCSNKTNSSMTSYDFTVTLTNNDNTNHTIHYTGWTNNCQSGTLGTCNGFSCCTKNDEQTNADVTVNANSAKTLHLKQYSLDATSACGSYQMDFNINGVDNNYTGACQYGNGSNNIGATGICQTGKSCSNSSITTYLIKGTIYQDVNGDGVYLDEDPNNADIPYTKSIPVTLTDINGNQTVINSQTNGNYIFQNLEPGQYTISINQSDLPANVSMVDNTTSFTVATGPDCASLKPHQADCTDEQSHPGYNINDLDFGYTFAPTATPTPATYTIQGNVFNDLDKNDILDNGESNYTGGITITSSGGTVTTNNGTYTISGLSAGTYTVSYTNLPSGYYTVYPKNGPPPSFLVTVGGGCSVDNTTGASCSNGNITNLNFAISNANPWVQLIDLDGRIDNGFKTTIPASANAQCGAYASIQDSNATNPGIPYSGDTSYDFGQGTASTKNWVVGGTVYPETTLSSGGNLRTSYNTLHNTITRAGLSSTDISTLTGCSNLSNCTLPANLSNGIYQANGNLILNSYNFPANKNYVFLINGNLTIMGNITIPNGSTALFSSAGDITIDKGIKASNDTCPAPSGQIQGMFSADKNFTVDGINDCSIGKDNMLNIEGTIVVNAARTGGTFTNNRDLCSNNAQYPSVTLKARPDFLFNAPSILAQQSTYSLEQAE